MKQGIASSRIVITLPTETVRLVERVAPKGGRSRFIADAITHFVEVRHRAELKKRLWQGAVRRAERDRMLAAKWFPLEEEASPRGGR